jgi:hypothetical protein
VQQYKKLSGTIPNSAAPMPKAEQENRGTNNIRISFVFIIVERSGLFCALVVFVILRALRGLVIGSG